MPLKTVLLGAKALLFPWGSVLALSLLLPLSSGCTDGCAKSNSPTFIEDADLTPRVFRPPPSVAVRAVPPHNIHKNGVGPYELSSRFQDALGLLPNGPRVEVFKAKGLFDFRLMRTENDALVIGVGRKQLVEFIAVLDPDIARTEGGIGVGAGLEELRGELGELLEPESGVKDSRIVTFSSLPGTRFLVEKSRIVAALIMSAPIALTESGEALQASSKQATATSGPDPKIPEPAEEASPLGLTQDCGVAKEIAAELRKQQERLQKDKRFDAVDLVCWPALKASLLLRRGDELSLAQVDKALELRSTAPLVVPGLRLATVLDTGLDSGSLYVLSESRGTDYREVILSRGRLVANRLALPWSKRAFRLQSNTASWIGAKIASSDFLVEMRGLDGAVSVGGIYVQRERGTLRDVVPIEPVKIPIERILKRDRPPEQAFKDGGIEPAIADAGVAEVPSSTEPKKPSN